MKKNILVGDIGSTKSTWWFDDKEAVEIQLPGYNPLMHAAETGIKLFSDVASSLLTKPTTIFYYGTGVVDAREAEKISMLLSPFFPDASIHIKSDLEGAAIAACGHQPGTVAILGTGSHAAVFDGKQITRQATSLGFILGDEGGGCDIGKMLLQTYFAKEMPEEISLSMFELLPEGRTGLLRELMNSPAPNQFLASFAQVAVDHKEFPWIRQAIRERFALFTRRYLLPLQPVIPVHIVGSIGCIFAGLIKEELEKAGLHSGEFISNPAFRLFERHLQYGEQS